ncbi:hypothetical protein T492DRAFT_21960 [Pavlovales sp. CCMP2436]|nr:hypothetical protein T492DRAFT_21960 [Pavlovales sp. CCMP2436]
MIAAVSPARASYEDTLNTLKYANRAKEIKLTASQNSVKVDFHIAKYAQIIESLRSEVALWRGKFAEAALYNGAHGLPAHAPGGSDAAGSAGGAPASEPRAAQVAAAAADRERGQACLFVCLFFLHHGHLFF